MNVIDWLLVAALVVFALVGWHRGFISGLMSFLGFLGGGLLAALILPRLLEASSMSTLARAGIVGLGILAACFAGQFIAGYFGDHIRDAISWTPARTVDRAGGAALNILVLAVLTWLVVSIASYLPSTSVTDQLTSSKVAGALDSLVPDQAQGVFDGIQSVLSTTSVPALFSGLAELSGPEVAPPDDSSITPEVERAGESVLQVTGYTDECASQVSGSGFVFEPGLVLTNAHVVAGLTKVQVRSNRSISTMTATVVFFDPNADIAILRVPDLQLGALSFAKEDATTGEQAAIGGYPHSGPFQLTPVRVRTKVSVRSDDIYGGKGGTRTVYIVRGQVKKGESGGPMLRPDGQVLGMVFGADPDQASNGYVIANSELFAAIARAGDSKERADTGSCRIRE